MESRKVLRILVRELERGRTLVAAGQRVGLSGSSVYRLIKDLPIVRLRYRRLTEKERRRIVGALRGSSLSRRQIAARFDRSISTVQRIASDLRKHPHGELPTPIRCPGCGCLVTRWPCLACEIERMRHAAASD